MSVKISNIFSTLFKKKKSTDKLRKGGAENRPDRNTKDLKVPLQT